MNKDCKDCTYWIDNVCVNSLPMCYKKGERLHNGLKKALDKVGKEHFEADKENEE